MTIKTAGLGVVLLFETQLFAVVAVVIRIPASSTTQQKHKGFSAQNKKLGRVADKRSLTVQK